MNEQQRTKTEQRKKEPRKKKKRKVTSMFTIMLVCG